MLGLPSFGMSLTVTSVSTFVPVVAREFEASTVAIGLIIGAEGMMALWLPLVVGSRSDRLRTRLGGRLPFVIAGTPVMLACLAVVGVVGSTLALALVVAPSSPATSSPTSPYRALYPDLVPDRLAGRRRACKRRSAGRHRHALASGGALLLSPTVSPSSLRRGAARLRRHPPSPPAPRHGAARPQRKPPAPAARHVFSHVARLLRERPALRAVHLANALWELSLGALKTFVVLYVSVGLGHSLGSASLMIGGVAVVVLVGAVVSGSPPIASGARGWRRPRSGSME